MTVFSPLRALAVAGLVGMFTFIAAHAAAPTTPEQRAEMIRLVEKLETAPYAADADEARGKVMTWLVDAPDVSVTLCAALLVDPDAMMNAGEDAQSLNMQLALSEARFILENADKAGDDHAVHVAGVEGVLRAYASMRATKPGLSLAPMDKLAKIKADGKIDDFVTKAIDQCT